MLVLRDKHNKRSLVWFLELSLEKFYYDLDAGTWILLWYERRDTDRLAMRVMKNSRTISLFRLYVREKPLE